MKDEILVEKLFGLLQPHLPTDMGIGERYSLINEIMEAVADYACDHRNDAFLEDKNEEALEQIDRWVAENDVAERVGFGPSRD